MSDLLHKVVSRAFRIRHVGDYTRELVDVGEVRTALDIGCGSWSWLTSFRPRIRTTGLDAHEPAIEASRGAGIHDEYVVADVLKDDPRRILERTGGEPFDLVCLYGVIEHLPKRHGWELLERCEALASKYVLLETPNGFQEQGPDYGNEHQRHLSGWMPHDFEGLGYRVYGSTGTRYLRGYGAGPKYALPGVLLADYVASWALRVNASPRHAFNIVAIKDVRGVPARKTA